MSADENESVLWVHRLVAGDDRVMLEFWQAYGPSLERLAQSRLAPALQRRVTAEEIAQSVCRTFLRRSQQGEFKLEGSEALWRLLCAITLTKVRQHARFHFRQKRGLHREVSLSDGDSHNQPAAPQHASPSDALDFADQMAFLLAKLDDEQRQIVEGKLEGQSHAEIAARLGCSQRTVRRLLDRIHQRWSEELGDALAANGGG